MYVLWMKLGVKRRVYLRPTTANHTVVKEFDHLVLSPHFNGGNSFLFISLSYILAKTNTHGAHAHTNKRMHPLRPDGRKYEELK